MFRQTAFRKLIILLKESKLPKKLENVNYAIYGNLGNLSLEFWQKRTLNNSWFFNITVINIVNVHGGIVCFYQC